MRYRMAALKKLKKLKKKWRNPAWVTLTCPSQTFNRGVLQILQNSSVKAVYFFDERDTSYLVRVPQGQLPKQKHLPEGVLGRSYYDKFPNFYGIEPLMKSFLS